MDELEGKLRKYMENAREKFENMAVVKPEGARVKDTAERYYSDAQHFLSKGKQVDAFAALEYAEGWLDAGTATGAIKTRSASDGLHEKNPGEKHGENKKTS
jgi:uncharacterized protein